MAIEPLFPYSQLLPPTPTQERPPPGAKQARRETYSDRDYSGVHADESTSSRIHSNNVSPVQDDFRRPASAAAIPRGTGFHAGRTGETRMCWLSGRISNQTQVGPSTHLPAKTPIGTKRITLKPNHRHSSFAPASSDILGVPRRTTSLPFVNVSSRSISDKSLPPQDRTQPPDRSQPKPQLPPQLRQAQSNRSYGPRPKIKPFVAPRPTNKGTGLKASDSKTSKKGNKNAAAQFKLRPVSGELEEAEEGQWDQNGTWVEKAPVKRAESAVRTEDEDDEEVQNNPGHEGPPRGESGDAEEGDKESADDARDSRERGSNIFIHPPMIQLSPMPEPLFMPASDDDDDDNVLRAPFPRQTTAGLSATAIQDPPERPATRRHRRHFDFADSQDLPPGNQAASFPTLEGNGAAHLHGGPWNNGGSDGAEAWEEEQAALHIDEPEPFQGTHFDHSIRIEDDSPGDVRRSPKSDLVLPRSIKKYTSKAPRCVPPPLAAIKSKGASAFDRQPETLTRGSGKKRKKLKESASEPVRREERSKHETEKKRNDDSAVPLLAAEVLSERRKLIGAHCQSRDKRKLSICDDVDQEADNMATEPLVKCRTDRGETRAGARVDESNEDEDTRLISAAKRNRAELRKRPTMNRRTEREEQEQVLEAAEPTSRKHEKPDALFGMVQRAGGIPVKDLGVLENGGSKHERVRDFRADIADEQIDMEPNDHHHMDVMPNERTEPEIKEGITQPHLHRAWSCNPLTPDEFAIFPGKHLVGKQEMKQRKKKRKRRAERQSDAHGYRYDARKEKRRALSPVRDEYIRETLKQKMLSGTGPPHNPFPVSDTEDEDANVGEPRNGKRVARGWPRPALEMFDENTPPSDRHVRSEDFAPLAVYDNAAHAAAERLWASDGEMARRAKIKAQGLARTTPKRRREHHPYDGGTLNMKRSASTSVRAQDWSTKVHTHLPSSRILLQSRAPPKPPRSLPRDPYLPAYIIKPIHKISIEEYNERYQAERPFNIDDRLIRQGLAELRENYHNRARTGTKTSHRGSGVNMASTRTIHPLIPDMTSLNTRIDTLTPSQYPPPHLPAGDAAAQCNHFQAARAEAIRRSKIPKLVFNARTPTPPISTQNRRDQRRDATTESASTGGGVRFVGRSEKDGDGAQGGDAGNEPLTRQAAATSIIRAPKSASADTNLPIPKDIALANVRRTADLDNLFDEVQSVDERHAVDSNPPHVAVEHTTLNDEARDEIRNDFEIDVFDRTEINPQGHNRTEYDVRSVSHLFEEPPVQLHVHDKNASSGLLKSDNAAPRIHMLSGLRLTDTMMEQLKRTRELASDLAVSDLAQPSGAVSTTANSALSKSSRAKDSSSSKRPQSKVVTREQAIGRSHATLEDWLVGEQPEKMDKGAQNPSCVPEQAHRAGPSTQLPARRTLHSVGPDHGKTVTAATPIASRPTQGLTQTQARTPASRLATQVNTPGVLAPRTTPYSPDKTFSQLAAIERAKPPSSPIVQAVTQPSSPPPTRPPRTPSRAGHRQQTQNHPYSGKTGAGVGMSSAPRLGLSRSILPSQRLFTQKQQAFPSSDPPTPSYPMMRPGQSSPPIPSSPTQVGGGAPLKGAGTLHFWKKGLYSDGRTSHGRSIGPMSSTQRDDGPISDSHHTGDLGGLHHVNDAHDDYDDQDDGMDLHDRHRRPSMQHPRSPDFQPTILPARGPVTPLQRTRTTGHAQAQAQDAPSRSHLPISGIQPLNTTIRTAAPASRPVSAHRAHQQQERPQELNPQNFRSAAQVPAPAPAYPPMDRQVQSSPIKHGFINMTPAGPLRQRPRGIRLGVGVSIGPTDPMGTTSSSKPIAGGNQKPSIRSIKPTRSHSARAGAPFKPLSLPQEAP